MFFRTPPSFIGLFHGGLSWGTSICLGRFVNKLFAIFTINNEPFVSFRICLSTFFTSRCIIFFHDVNSVVFLSVVFFHFGTDVFVLHRKLSGDFFLPGNFFLLLTGDFFLLLTGDFFLLLTGNLFLLLSGNFFLLLAECSFLSLLSGDFFLPGNFFLLLSDCSFLSLLSGDFFLLLADCSFLSLLFAQTCSRPTFVQTCSTCSTCLFCFFFFCFSV